MKYLKTFESKNKRILDYINLKIIEYKPFAKDGITEQELKLIHTTGINSTISTYNDNEMNGNDYPIVSKFNKILFYLIYEKIKFENKLDYFNYLSGLQLIWTIYTIDKFIEVRLYDNCKEKEVGNKLLDFTFTFEELLNPIRFKATNRFDL